MPTLTVPAPDAQTWLEELPPEQRHEAEVLARAVEDAIDGVETAVKWKRLTFTLDGDWHHWLCAIAASGAGVRLVFHKGSLLDDPEGVLEGDGKYLRDVPYADAVARSDSLATLLRQAAERRTEMLEAERE